MKEIKFDLLENVPILKHNLIELHVILQLYSIYKISRKSRIIINIMQVYYKTKSSNT